jgi:ribosome-binding factor A
MPDENLRAAKCFIDALKQTSSKWEEWVKNAQEFLARISPKITFGADTLFDSLICE